MFGTRRIKRRPFDVKRISNSRKPQERKHTPFQQEMEKRPAAQKDEKKVQKHERPRQKKPGTSLDITV